MHAWFRRTYVGGFVTPVVEATREYVLALGGFHHRFGERRECVGDESRETRDVPDRYDHILDAVRSACMRTSDRSIDRIK